MSLRLPALCLLVMALGACTTSGRSSKMQGAAPQAASATAQPAGAAKAKAPVAKPKQNCTRVKAPDRIRPQIVCTPARTS